MRFVRLAVVLAALAGTALLFLALRPDGDDEDAAPETVRFAVSVGEEGPDEREQLRVRRGQRVELTVTLPYEGDVHLHGYDVMASTGPGEPPARLEFVADTPGRFELEAHGRWETIARLIVEP